MELIKLLRGESHHKRGQVKVKVINDFGLHDVQELVHAIGHLMVYI